MQQTIETKRRIGITPGELFTALVIIVTAMLGFWKTTDVRLSALELRMDLIEKEKEKTDEKINQKLDRLQETVNDVKISLQNKQDKQ
jgi:tetrahydromethanopterin S-methyltransferase subunit F